MLPTRATRLRLFAHVGGVALALAAGGCRNGRKRADEAPSTPPAVVIAVTDAGVTATPSASNGGITQLPTFDPNSGMHVDNDDSDDDDSDTAVPPSHPPALWPTHTQAPTRSRRTVEIVLRSSPPGAVAAVDGVLIGPTPTYWESEFDGHSHDFTFVMPGHSLARYRFVPVSNGTVHAKLARLTDGEADPSASVLATFATAKPAPEPVPPPAPARDHSFFPPPPASPAIDAAVAVAPDAGTVHTDDAAIAPATVDATTP